MNTRVARITEHIRDWFNALLGEGAALLIALVAGLIAAASLFGDFFRRRAR